MIHRLDVIKMVFNEISNEKCIKQYACTKEVLLSLVEDTKNNEKLIEELICDLMGFNQCLDVVLLDVANRQNRCSKNDIVTQCMEALHLLTTFTGQLLALQAQWDFYLKQFGYKTSFELSSPTIARNYLFEVLSLHELCNRGLNQFYTSECWKYGSITENNVYNSFIYDEFLSLEAVERHRNKALFQNNSETREEIFELLGWRI